LSQGSEDASIFTGKVMNGVRTAADVARVLGIEAKAS
jgi:hypothetical protein